MFDVRLNQTRIKQLNLQIVDAESERVKVTLDLETEWYCNNCSSFF